VISCELTNPQFRLYDHGNLLYIWTRRGSGVSFQLQLARSALEADRLANGRVVLRVGQGDAACANFRLNFHGGLLFLSFGFLDDVSG
jgi:hypothetical protein